MSKTFSKMNSDSITLLIWVMGAGALGGVVTAMKLKEPNPASYIATILGGAITGAFAAGIALMKHPGVPELVPIFLAGFCGMTQEQVRGLFIKRIEKLT